MIEVALDEGSVSGTKPIDIFPCGRSIERELIWGRPYYGPITFVQFQHYEWLLATEKCVRVRHVAPCCEARTGKSVERVPNMEINSTTEYDNYLSIRMSSSFAFGEEKTHQ
jgi:hypothetical protein